MGELMRGHRALVLQNCRAKLFAGTGGPTILFEDCLQLADRIHKVGARGWVKLGRGGAGSGSLAESQRSNDVTQGLVGRQRSGEHAKLNRALLAKEVVEVEGVIAGGAIDFSADLVEWISGSQLVGPAPFDGTAKLTF